MGTGLFIITVQHGFHELSGEIGFAREYRVGILKESIKQAHFLFRGLSVELLIILIAGLGGRL